MTELMTIGEVEAGTAERRRHARQASALRVRLSGPNAEGRRFDAEAELKDISAGGCYLRLAERVEAGAAVVAEIALGPHDTDSQWVSFGGTVRRVERLVDTRYGVAVEFAGGESDGGHN